MPNISSDVAMGRWMKGAEMLIADSLWRASGKGAARPADSTGRLSLDLFDSDARALGQAVLAVDDDALAGVEPLGHDGDPVLHRSDLDRTAFRLFVVADQVHVIAGGSDLHGLRRHRRDVLPRV